MEKVWAFDMPDALRITEARWSLARQVLSDLTKRLDLKSALDVGCGVGYFSAFLRDMGFHVVGLDGRSENVEEAQKRFPDMKFHHLNVEESAVRQLGSFDLVLCFGLLYHLENPFAAVRNLHALTNKVLLIESVCVPGREPILSLRDEWQSQDQGLRFIAFYPSESCLIKMCYKAGFPFVYRFNQLPLHEDFQMRLSRRRARTMLAASRVPLDFPFFSLTPEPVSVADPWTTAWAHIQYPFHRIKNFFRKPWHERLRRFLRKPWSEKARSVQFRFKRLWNHWLPLPVHIWCRVWCLTWNDVMGEHIRQRDNFEQGEQSFLLQFLESGMTVLDTGAHHGLYTLLASRKVGSQGNVIAFEPSPRELRRLRWNLLLNRCRNVRVVPSAVGSIEGTEEFFICLGRETGCNSLRPPAVNEPVSKVQVPITTLDRYIERNGINKLDFVKLDVEGAELDVLKGGEQHLVLRLRPLILCELADVRTEPWGYGSVEIYDFLRNRGYRWFSVTPDGKLHLCPRKEHFHENLLAVPEEKLGLVATFRERLEEQCLELP